MLLKLLSGIVNMSMTASIVIIAVLLLRLVLKKAPKVYSYLLWFIVLFRLLCPVSISSAVSLMGMFDTPVTEEGVITYIPYVDNSAREVTKVHFDVIPEGISLKETPREEKLETTYDLQEIMILVLTGEGLWIAGVAALLIYSIFSLARLKKNLVGSVKVDDRIYHADHIVTPFVMGIIYPRIYLPSALTETEKNYILMHEKHHIKRGDHIFKALFYLTLCVYWFNPLVWVSFYLFVKDMEMSCDEAVMNHMTEDIRAEYSSSLLCLATGRRMMTGVPLAFGEGDTGDRIKNILNWKKPRVWVAALAVVLCLAAAFCLSTNPKASGTNKDTVNDPVLDDIRAGLNGSEVFASAEEALKAAVINYNRHYALSADFHCASVVVLNAVFGNKIAINGQEPDDLSKVDYYVYSLYKDMDLSEDGITERVTICSSMVITLDRDGGFHIVENGVKTMNEFTDEDYEKYVLEDPDALFAQYGTVLSMDCHAQAVEYGQLDTDAIIGGLVNHIAGEPLASSATQEYIDHSPVEYRELIYYGKYTIAYAEAYRQTGATDLKMAILDCAEEEIRSYIERPDEAQQEQLNEQIAQQEWPRTLLSSLPWPRTVWPTTGSTISQTFGSWQKYDGEIYYSDHICIAGEEGDPVYAAMDGVVEETGFTSDYGNYIVILYRDELYDEIRTRYGHLNSVEVTEGTQVVAGEEIGTVGKTGRATGNCLQFAITDHGVPIDPLRMVQSD